MVERLQKPDELPIERRSSEPVGELAARK